jgi:hypothetical protein
MLTCRQLDQSRSDCPSKLPVKRAPAARQICPTKQMRVEFSFDGKEKKGACDAVHKIGQQQAAGDLPASLCTLAAASADAVHVRRGVVLSHLLAAQLVPPVSIGVHRGWDGCCGWVWHCNRKPASYQTFCELLEGCTSPQHATLAERVVCRVAIAAYLLTSWPAEAAEPSICCCAAFSSGPQAPCQMPSLSSRKLMASDCHGMSGPTAVSRRPRLSYPSVLCTRRSSRCPTWW